METNLDKENQAESDQVVGIKLLKETSLLSLTSKPSIELVLDDTHEPSKDLPSVGKRQQSNDVNIENRLEATRYMNTYRLESKTPFNVEKVVGILKEVLTRELEEAAYEPGNAMKTCLTLSAEIRTRVKSFNFDRYKIICLVSIVEKQMQDVLSMAKFLWDTDRDRFATFSLSNTQLASMACVFGIYYE